MMRLVCESIDAGMAINVGGSVCREMKTFDVDLPEVEKWLSGRIGTYETRILLGAEILTPSSPSLPEHYHWIQPSLSTTLLHT